MASSDSDTDNNYSDSEYSVEYDPLSESDDDSGDDNNRNAEPGPDG